MTSNKNKCFHHIETSQRNKQDKFIGWFPFDENNTLTHYIEQT